ncbi:hypothetical protein EJB05_35910 [Eragrostis curvula]|uniref:Uncharacterized protein n=1 Tax=Eragrostis curvula TaxID=38414 RepID=A0A5J9U979_9POAL|nr:hypothetical protein EJB05_35910 [Eragrostis curvula]
MDTENTLVRTCMTDFDLEGLILSGHIKEHLNQLLQSGCESSAAAAALLCITKENELILDVSNRDFDVKEDISFANEVRRCASAFLLYKGSEYDSDAAAGVMLGMAKEADLMTHSSEGEHCYASVDYVICEKIRKRAVESLVALEKELVSKTDADGSPVGVAGDMISIGSATVGNSEENMSNSNSKSKEKAMVPCLANTEDKDFDG